MSSLIKKLISFYKPKEDDLESFFDFMNSDQWSEFIGQDEIRMIRGVFEVSELQVRDIMIPRSNMTVLILIHPYLFFCIKLASLSILDFQ